MIKLKRFFFMRDKHYFEQLFTSHWAVWPFSTAEITSYTLSLFPVIKIFPLSFISWKNTLYK